MAVVVVVSVVYMTFRPASGLRTAVLFAIMLDLAKFSKAITVRRLQRLQSERR